VAGATKVIGNSNGPPGLNHQNAHDAYPNSRCRVGLTAKVKILSGQVKAKAAGHADKVSVMARQGGWAGSRRAALRSPKASGSAGVHPPWLRADFRSTSRLSPRTYDGATMNDIARQLRAQIPSSTDPDRLEQMAREAEGRTSPLRTQCVDSRGSESECPEYPEWVKPDARRLRPSCAADAQEFHANEGKQLRGFPARLQQLSARSPELRRI
jgi:hypothetical protein